MTSNGNYAVLEEEEEHLTPLLRDDQALEDLYNKSIGGQKSKDDTYTSAVLMGRARNRKQQQHHQHSGGQTSRQFRISDVSRSLESESLLKGEDNQTNLRGYDVELNSSINSQSSSWTEHEKTMVNALAKEETTNAAVAAPWSPATVSAIGSHHRYKGRLDKGEQQNQHEDNDRNKRPTSGGDERKDRNYMNKESPRLQQRNFKNKFKVMKTSPQLPQKPSSLPTNETSVFANSEFDKESVDKSTSRDQPMDQLSIAVSQSSDSASHYKKVPQSPSRQPFIPKRNTLLASKVRYYSSLRHIQKENNESQHKDSAFLLPPVHLIDPTMFGLDDEETSGKTQSSWATISTIVNTMMGTTVVALPFGFAHAGIAMSLLLIGIIGFVACFTCTLIVHHGKDFDEFSDFVRHYMGARMQFLSWIMSIFVIVGAAMIYHILMQESFYEVVQTILKHQGVSTDGWSRPVAALVPLIVFPFSNLKTIKKLVKFNGIGFLFLWYTLIFIFYHGIKTIAKNEADYVGTAAGTGDGIEKGHLTIVYGARPTFGSLSGMMMLSFFIHNCIQPIVKNAPVENRKRDIILAYTLAGTCYALVGTLGYLGFADTDLKKKGSLSGNFLEMFPTSFATGEYIYAFTARASLMCQLLVVYPVLVFIIRTQTLGYLYDNTHPGYLRVILTSSGIFSITYIIAALNVDVAAVTRFSGAICGYILIFLVPVGVDYLIRRRDSTWTFTWRVLHAAMMLLGSTVFIIQFIPALSP